MFCTKYCPIHTTEDTEADGRASKKSVLKLMDHTEYTVVELPELLLEFLKQRTKARTV